MDRLLILSIEKLSKHVVGDSIITQVLDKLKVISNNSFFFLGMVCNSGILPCFLPANFGFTQIQS